MDLLLRRIALTTLLALIALGPSAGLGCGTGPETPEAALRSRFPAHAARVIGEGAALAAVEGGFAATGASGITVELPATGDGAVRLRLPEAEGRRAIEIRVRELGAAREGAPAGRAIAYAREGGTSFWSATDAGAEEWLWLDEARGGRAPIAWDVEGARLRQDGDAVVLDDEGGAARLRVTAPEAFAADGRAVGARLYARGARIELVVDEAGEVLVNPAWIATGSMSFTRQNHTATLLPNGKVMIAGGVGTGAQYRATSEQYNPATGTWASTGSMSNSRQNHTATLLTSGLVLVAGGHNFTAVAASQTWDPATSLWTPAAVMVAARYAHTATLLPSGKVIAAGGFDGNAYLGSAELYDPATNTWAAAPSLVTTRGFHTATLLGTGKVLIAGGSNAGSSLASAELYDPVANTWAPAASMAVARLGHTATLLPSGKVLIAGGTTVLASLASCELYDPATDTWSPAAAMTGPRASHGAELIPATGKVVVAGGFDPPSTLSSSELYDPAANTWTATGTMVAARASFTLTALGTGKVLAAGGGIANGTALQTAELYNLLAQGTACAASIDCLSGFCADGFCCDTACAAGACDACSIAAGGAANGTCTLFSNKPCTDGNGCTSGDTCQAGVCMGSPVVCPAPGACKLAGTCDPQQGLCVYPPDADGTMCNDGNACTQTDTCQAGACTGQSPVVCPPPAGQCLATGVCNPATGVCSVPSQLPNGSPCDDGNLCTQTDFCQSGICSSGQPVVCAPLDSCHTAGVCSPMTGCSNPVKMDGSACDDGSACTQMDTCQAGTCTGAPMACAPLDTCHDPGTCNPATGVCSSPVKPDGSACDDGNACSPTDVCIGGMCQGSGSVVCVPQDQCHTAGLCDPATGCANPEKANGALCDDGNACTGLDSCKSGICVGKSPVLCMALDVCHAAGVCDPPSGMCSNPNKVDGTACPGGTCQSGICSPIGTSAASSSSTSASSGSAGGGGSSTSTGGGGAGGSGGAGGATSSTTTGTETGTTTGTETGTTTGTGDATSGTTGEGGSTSSSGATGTGGGGPGQEGGCGCGVRGSPAGGAMWLALGLILAMRRRATTCHTPAGRS